MQRKSLSRKGKGLSLFLLSSKRAVKSKMLYGEPYYKRILAGAEGRTRTGTLLKAVDFESTASANSATSAWSSLFILAKKQTDVKKRSARAKTILCWSKVFNAGQTKAWRGTIKKAEDRLFNLDSELEVNGLWCGQGRRKNLVRPRGYSIVC